MVHKGFTLDLKTHIGWKWSDGEGQEGQVGNNGSNAARQHLLLLTQVLAVIKRATVAPNETAPGWDVPEPCNHMASAEDVDSVEHSHPLPLSECDKGTLVAAGGRKGNYQ